MEVSPHHTMAGEICGFFTWLWVFYRAKHDLPVVLGMRHPWEHGEDPFAIHDHVDNLEGLEKEWEDFTEKSTRPGEDDDDDDDVSFVYLFMCVLDLIYIYLTLLFRTPFYRMMMTTMKMRMMTMMNKFRVGFNGDKRGEG